MFIDLRRKVGNNIIRAYLLQPVMKSDRIRVVSARLKGPGDAFKDFAKFLIVRTKYSGRPVQLLVETGVYENLRIVATDDMSISELTAREIIELFTESLMNPDVHELLIFKSGDSRGCQ